MYFDDPADKVTSKADVTHGAVMLITGLFISPLGYLLTNWLGGLAHGAAAALFHAAA